MFIMFIFLLLLFGVLLIGLGKRIQAIYVCIASLFLATVVFLHDITDIVGLSL